MKTAFITGATSGIGRATARRLAPNYRLILCGRRKERLEELKEELSSQTEIITLLFDVRNKQSVFESFASLPLEWQKVDLLINNAGNAHGLASFQEADIEDLENMMDGNVKGIIYVTKAVLPLMLPQSSGHIVNLSSIAGKQVYANGTTYCASKWAVEALSKGMRLDLLPHGIKVTNIAPGAVETEFSLVRFKGDEEKSANVYAGFQALTAEDIAETIYFAVSQPDHVQIGDVTITPKAQADGVTILRNLNKS
jgi:3-hydroxy acid dehydrogenase/malonic semialdehyde reductase